jgi:hypothetical protein
VKPSPVGVFDTTLIAPLVTAVNALSGESVSVAVRVQLVPAEKLTAPKVATPAAAVTVSVPASVHPADDVAIATVSRAPTPVVMTLPWESSTDTLKVVNDTPMVAAVGGPVVYAILFAVLAAIGIAALTTGVNVSSGASVSVAVRVQEPAVSMMMPVKVATAELAVWVVVPLLIVHDEVSAMVSDAPVPVAGLPPPSSTVTTMFERATPAVPDAGVVVKTKCVPAAADAGETATNARPDTMRADVAPMAAMAFAMERMDLRPTLRFTKLFIGFPPFALPVRIEHLNMCLMGTKDSIGKEVEDSLCRYVTVRGFFGSASHNSRTDERNAVHRGRFMNCRLFNKLCARIHNTLRQ